MQFKLQQARLVDEIILLMTCSDDVYARVAMMRCVDQKSIEFYQQSQFETVTSVGDGVTAKQLDDHFIEIGTEDRATDLLGTSAKDVFPHHQNLAEIMSIISR